MALSGRRGLGVASMLIATVMLAVPALVPIPQADAATQADAPAQTDAAAQPERLLFAERLLTGAAAGASAQLGRASGRLDTTVEPTFDLFDVHCAPDARDDTFLVDTSGGEETRTPFTEPRADILGVCADYGEELTLRLRVAQPTDPAQWSGQTGLYWYVDVDGGGAFDRAVVYRGGDTGPVAMVAQRHDGRWQHMEGCDASAGYLASTAEYVASGIPAACLGDADRVEVGAVLLFETPAGLEVHDTTAVRLAVGRTGAPTRRPSERLSGSDRFATAVAISRARFPTRATVVYLARSDGFADALAAGSLAATSATAGPILLVRSCGALPQPVAEEIERLDPPQVVALGGQSAVCDDVLAEAGEVGGARRATGRLAGGTTEPTRWGTAVAISMHAYPVSGVDEVYLATGEAFPDALAAGPLDRGPLLLVPSCSSLPAVVRGELSRLAPGRVVALGGSAAVCEDVLTEAIEASGGEALAARLSGPTRFDTAAAISAHRFGDGAERVYVARAEDFPDALAGAVLTGGPILLVPRCGDLPVAVGQEIRRLDPALVVGLGGGGAVCEQTLRHAANA